MNKLNLDKLADFLENEITDEQFDMKYYRSNNGRNVNFISKNHCGTVGCALGWSPFIIPEQNEDFSCLRLDFGKYLERVFNIDENSIYYEYMFGFKWTYTGFESTRLAAIGRIRDVAYELVDELNAEYITKLNFNNV